MLKSNYLALEKGRYLSIFIFKSSIVFAKELAKLFYEKTENVSTMRWPERL